MIKKEKEEEKKVKYYLDTENDPFHQIIMKLGYFYNIEGELKDITNPSKGFAFTNKFEYDKLSNVIISYVQNILVTKYAMKEIFIPIAIDNNGKDGPVKIFLSCILNI